LGIGATSSETAFHHPPEVVYDFVTDPANWTKTYPTSAHIGKLPDVSLKVGDTWEEAGPAGDKVFTWHLAIAIRPRMWVFDSVGLLGHDPEGKGGREGRMTIAYHFSQPDPGITLFSRTVTIEAYRDAPLPDRVFLNVNPANIDAYHAAVARELAL
jgi:hypothetical protein